MSDRTTFGRIADVWAEHVCALARRTLEANACSALRVDQLAHWRRLHQLDTVMIVAALEARERLHSEPAPFPLRDFVSLMQRGGCYESTMALVRRCFAASAEFGLVRMEGRPRRVRMGATDVSGWLIGVRQIGEQLRDASRAWADACGPARRGAPIRDWDTARCLSLMVDAGLAPGRPVFQREVLRHMLDEDGGLLRRYAIETTIARRSFDLRARARLALARRRAVLVAHGVLVAEFTRVNDVRLTLTPQGAVYHAALLRGTARLEETVAPSRASGDHAVTPFQGVSGFRDVRSGRTPEHVPA